eukprot:CAMPEP_0172416580 /NCGR_PEP_ID=MMETSP1064-20121228/3094_1 /TAXON_ID=202472 /ORGANISM="Aulacoseira subarctica , Strain CCAP 1002/5" /LENGTH=264 /DNA_ID=CAMNT_0013154373 /DNA_START=73 /DNA_END=867 /DNA_ORIENTATION=-
MLLRSVLSLTAIFSSVVIVNARVLTTKEHRKLSWTVEVPTSQNIANDVWYTDYDASEIPLGLDSIYADKEDFFRKADMCYNPADQTFSNSNCPAEIDCSHLNSTTLGEAKLCINRAPTNQGQFYVVLQKCIPKWENCDKCLCGTMLNGGGSSGTCIVNTECNPDDDRLEIDCVNPSQVTIMGDTTFNSATGTFIGATGDVLVANNMTLQPAGADAAAMAAAQKASPADNSAGGATKAGDAAKAAGSGPTNKGRRRATGSQSSSW